MNGSGAQAQTNLENRCDELADEIHDIRSTRTADSQIQQHPCLPRHPTAQEAMWAHDYPAVIGASTHDLAAELALLDQEQLLSA